MATTSEKYHGAPELQLGDRRHSTPIQKLFRSHLEMSNGYEAIKVLVLTLVLLILVSESDICKSVLSFHLVFYFIE